MTCGKNDKRLVFHQRLSASLERRLVFSVRVMHTHSISASRLNMTAKLGRSTGTTERPSTILYSEWVLLPQAAYRLLIDYLRCDPVFCNCVVPRFLPFGWVVLSVIDEKPQACQPVREGHAGERELRNGRRRLGGTASMAVQEEQSEEKRDA